MTTNRPLSHIEKLNKILPPPGITRDNYFDIILNERWDKGFCHTCAGYQSHNIRWCYTCGVEFCTGHNHSQLERMVIARRITYKEKHNASDQRPAYIAAVNQRHIRRAGFSERDFESYAEQRIIEELK